MRVAVVGAGAVGLTAAHDLARGGATVTVYERGSVGGGSTGRAAGVLYDAYAEDVDAAVGARAIERFRAFDGEGAFAFTETPYVWFVTEPGRRADAVREQVDRMRAHGRDVALADPGELDERFPALETGDVEVAAIARNAGYADPAAYVDLLADRARRARVTIREGVTARVRTDPPRAAGRSYDAVVVAAGARTRSVLADAGVDLAVKPYRVQALTAATPAGGFPMFYDATAGYYARPHPTGVLAGDGTEEREADPDAWRAAADREFLDAVADRLAGRLDGAAVSGDRPADLARSWAGLCTATPDRDPLLGPVADGVHVATGWQGHGFMRAPALGELLAAVVRGDRESPFDPRRFDGDEEFEVVEGMALPEN